MINENGKRVLLTSLASIMLFSGSAKLSKGHSLVISEDGIYIESITDKLEIDEIYRNLILDNLKLPITHELVIEDLKDIKVIKNVPIFLNCSLKWINYCSNLEAVTFKILDDNVGVLKEIDSMESIKLIGFISNFNAHPSLTNINYEDMTVLNRFPSLKSLVFSGIAPDVKFIEEYKQLRQLYLDPYPGLNTNYDWSKLTHLSKLYFTNDPYDIAIMLDTKDIEILNSNGVDVVLNKEDLNTLNKINKRLDLIVSSLGVSIDDRDDVKLNAILNYIIKTLKYDIRVINGEIDISDISDTFYKKGELYASLECEGVICGNYASLVSALCYRLNIDSEYLISVNHAWNLININGTSYHVDSTWLDKEYEDILSLNKAFLGNMDLLEFIDKGYSEYLKWYMIPSTKLEEIDENKIHVPINIGNVDTKFDNYKVDKKIDLDKLAFITSGVLGSLLMINELLKRLNNTKKLGKEKTNL